MHAQLLRLFVTHVLPMLFMRTVRPFLCHNRKAEVEQEPQTLTMTKLVTTLSTKDVSGIGEGECGRVGCSPCPSQPHELPRRLGMRP